MLSAFACLGYMTTVSYAFAVGAAAAVAAVGDYVDFDNVVAGCGGGGGCGDYSEPEQNLDREKGCLQHD